MVGVGEAHLEHIVLPGDGHIAFRICLTADNIGGGGGGSQLKDPVRIGLGGNGDTGSRGGGAHQNLHAPVLQVVVGVDGLLGVVLVVLPVDLKLNAAQRVDLFHGKLRTVLGGVAVDSSRTSQGANAAQLDGAAGGSVFGGAGCGLGAGILSYAAFGAGAARGHRHNHGHSQKHSKKLLDVFHNIFLHSCK